MKAQRSHNIESNTYYTCYYKDICFLPEIEDRRVSHHKRHIETGMNVIKKWMQQILKLTLSALVLEIISP